MSGLQKSNTVTLNFLSLQERVFLEPKPLWLLPCAMIVLTRQLLCRQLKSPQNSNGTCTFLGASKKHNTSICEHVWKKTSGYKCDPPCLNSSNFLHANSASFKCRMEHGTGTTRIEKKKEAESYQFSCRFQRGCRNP